MVIGIVVKQTRYLNHLSFWQDNLQNVGEVNRFVQRETNENNIAETNKRFSRTTRLHTNIFQQIRSSETVIQ